MEEGLQAELVPGALYRDVDGTVVELLEVADGLCTWTLIAEHPTPLEVTHAENFRRRFHRWQELAPLPAELREPA